MNSRFSADGLSDKSKTAQAKAIGILAIRDHTHAAMTPAAEIH